VASSSSASRRIFDVLKLIGQETGDLLTNENQTEEAQRRSIDEWFATYDALSLSGDVEGMANMAMFPIHVVTETSDGNGYAEDWTRVQFVQTMREAMQGTPKDMHMKTTRTPFFLSPDMVVVITDATFTIGDKTQSTRYADILVKASGDWKFQTMAQSGWGDMLKARGVSPDSH
jgi:hypothetical protein